MLSLRDLHFRLAPFAATVRTAAVRAVLCAVLGVVAVACGGSGATAPPEPTTPKPSLPVLTVMTVILPQDTVAASQSVAARVDAFDERARPITVGSIGWTSLNPEVATVSSDGVILARAPGTATIRAQVGDVVGQRVITVTPPPPGPLPIASVDVTPRVSDMDIGASLQFTAMPRDFAGRALEGRDIQWTSSNDSIAIVSSDGIVTARGVGSAIIEAVGEGQRGAAAITVRTPLNTNIVVTIAAPIEATVLGDSVVVRATVRSVSPLDSVVVTISGRSYPMQGVVIVSPSGLEQTLWTVTADVSLLPYGPLAVVVTATDRSGQRGLAIVPVVRNPSVSGGGKQTGGSK